MAKIFKNFTSPNNLCSSSSSENEEIQEQLTVANQTIVGLNTQVSELNTTVVILSGELATEKEKNLQLFNQVGVLTEENVGLNNQISELSQEIEDLKEELASGSAVASFSLPQRLEDMNATQLIEYAKSQEPPINIGNTTSAGTLLKKIQEAQQK